MQGEFLKRKEWLMIRSRMTWGAVLAAVLLAPAFAAQAQVKVGQVNIVSLVDEYERTKDAEADAKVEEANLKAAAEPKIKQIEDLRLQRDQFNQGSDEWKRLDERAMEAELQLRTSLAIDRARLLSRQRNVLIDIFRDIQNTIARVAKREGLDFVFAKAFIEPGQVDIEEIRTLGDLKRRIVATAMLYPSDVKDITQEVMQILNEDYKESKRTGGAVPKG
jgi:Skp family chaperone for outer membrane proteins